MRLRLGGLRLKGVTAALPHAGIDLRDLAADYGEAEVRRITDSTGIDAVRWAELAEASGAGEILLTSMDADGTKDGFDTTMLRQIRAAVS